VVVSFLGRPIIGSAAPNEPRRNPLSPAGRDGDVTNTEGPSLMAALLKGDDPARVRKGILVNLICCTGLSKG
jgi:hypothetical protein